MKINKSKLMRHNTLLNFIIIEGLVDTLNDSEWDKFIKEQWENKSEIEFKFTIEGVEVNIENFMERWQNNVKRHVKEKAEELLQEKFNDIGHLLEDLQNRIKPEIKQRLEDWEK